MTALYNIGCVSQRRLDSWRALSLGFTQTERSGCTRGFEQVTRVCKPLFTFAGHSEQQLRFCRVLAVQALIDCNTVADLPCTR